MIKSDIHVAKLFLSKFVIKQEQLFHKLYKESPLRTVKLNRKKVLCNRKCDTLCVCSFTSTWKVDQYKINQLPFFLTFFRWLFFDKYMTCLQPPKGSALTSIELEHIIHNPHTYHILYGCLIWMLLAMRYIPDLDTHLPGLCLSLSASMDANRKWRNHSSFSRPVRPKR